MLCCQCVYSGFVQVHPCVFHHCYLGALPPQVTCLTVVILCCLYAGHVLSPVSGAVPMWQQVWCWQLSTPHLSQAASWGVGRCPSPPAACSKPTGCSSRLQCAPRAARHCELLQRVCALPCESFKSVSGSSRRQYPTVPAACVPCECWRPVLRGAGLPCTSELASACCNASSGVVAAQLQCLGDLPLSADPARACCRFGVVWADCGCCEQGSTHNTHSYCYRTHKGMFPVVWLGMLGCSLRTA
jgi:hypothetical protein